MFLQSNLTLRQGLVVTLLHFNIDVQLTINYHTGADGNSVVHYVSCVFFLYGYGGFNKLANTKKVVYLVKGGKRPHMGIDY